MLTRILVFAALLTAAPAAGAQPFSGAFLEADRLTPWLQRTQEGKQKPRKKITLDNLPAGKGGFDFATPLTWLDDEHFLQSKGGKVPLKVQALTGKAEPLYDADRLAQGLAELPDFGKDRARDIAQKPAQLMNPQRTAALFQSGGQYFFCKLDGSAGASLPKLAGAEMPTFSPDGKRVAFVRNGNLHVLDLETQKDRQLTKDGSDGLSNGKADWVYYEEIFHRKYHAFWWSPDSAHIAFLQFDDRKVAKYTLIRPTDRVQSLEVATYPKAGAVNPTVKLGIAAVNDAPVSWVDLSDYPDTSLLVIRAGWFPDGKRAYFFVQDRAQTWLDVCATHTTGGKPAKLFRDTTRAWVEDPGPLQFLKDGSFLFFSERTGYKHLYHYAADGALKHAVTQGNWEARKLERVDESGGCVYFSGTRDGWLGSNLYRVRLDGGDPQRLTKEEGAHTVSVSPGARFFVDSWSTFDTPPRVTLCRADGTLARVIDAGSPNKLAESYELGKHEFVQIRMPDGFMLPATVLLPPDFDATKKYPVWFMTYGGPHAPTIRNAWSGGGMRDQAYAAMGCIIFRFDPRSASSMGAVSTWTAYRQLGVQELKDIEAALQWLIKTYPAVDAARIGMSGHSYGGYITAYALTHSKMFAAGIAGAPVTDWHNYDSIYTERYMGLPEDNPKGYEVSSVVKAARNLHGKLLILHGMMDDNVHVQNTMELTDALQKADRDFEVMYYPHARHGLFGSHYQRLQISFMKRVLQP
jgi:dipeptidyl-peptidase-4